MRYLVRKLLTATLVMMAVVLLAGPTEAQVSIGVGLPGISIGINVPVFPTFTVVPDYPVYYASQANVNLFFYDGLYWVYQRDNWYASSWYDGPWDLYAPEFVPVFILRVPVRYYVSPPIYFRGWEPYGPPRWGEHWGRSWEQNRRGWDQWDRRQAQRPRETQQGPPVVQHQQAAPQQQPQERQQRTATPPQMEQPQQHGPEKGHGHEKD